MEARTILNGVLVGAIALVLLWAFATPPGSWGDGSPSSEPEDPDYWLIHLVGTESRTVISGNESETQTCERPAGFEVHEGSEELVVASQHDQDRVARDGRALVLELMEEWSGCPIAYGIATQTLLERQLGHYGWFYYEIVENGTVYLGNGSTLRPGDTMPVEYTAEMEEGNTTYRVEGRFELVHHGAWAKDEIRLQAWD